jgi:hypothetical protein
MKKLDKVTASEFGVRMAKALLENPSSHAFFFVQQAFDAFGEMPWEEVEKILKKVSRERKHK